MQQHVPNVLMTQTWYMALYKCVFVGWRRRRVFHCCFARFHSRYERIPGAASIAKILQRMRDHPRNTKSDSIANFDIFYFTTWNYESNCFHSQLASDWLERRPSYHGRVADWCSDVRHATDVSLIGDAQFDWQLIDR